MTQGTVKWYDPTKGYGFICPDGGGTDVFVDREALRGAEPIPGDRVTFALAQSPNGPIAKRVQLVTSAAATTRAPQEDEANKLVVPVHEERLTATTHEVELGEALIHTRTETEPVSTTVDVGHDELRLERVQINRPVEVAPEPRIEDDVIIVPVLAEEVVTAKRLILREEIRIHRRRVTEAVPVQETVRRQVVDVEGRAAPGVTPTTEPAPDAEHGS